MRIGPRIGKRGAVGILLLFLAGACADEAPSQPQAQPATEVPAPLSPRPSTSAMLAIATPEAGAVIRGDTLDLAIELDGATLSDVATTDLQPDEGHLHVLLDDQLVSMTSGLKQSLEDLSPGEHLLKVEFVANDHAPFDPRVISAVSFTVRST